MKSIDKLTRKEMRDVWGEDLRKYRNEECYSQEYMAKQLGLAQSTYQRIESGEIKISKDRLIKIAEILNRPVEALEKNNGYNIKSNPKGEILSGNEIVRLKKKLSS